VPPDRLHVTSILRKPSHTHIQSLHKLCRGFHRAARRKHADVCDRQGDRIQVFDKMGNFRKNIWIKRGRSLPDIWGTTWWIGFSSDREQKYMYVADGGDEEVKILDRASGEMLSSFGRPGHQLGEFTHAHTLEHFTIRLTISGIEEICCTLASREILETGADDRPPAIADTTNHIRNTLSGGFFSSLLDTIVIDEQRVPVRCVMEPRRSLEAK
jgi:hypothetical protein